MIQFQTGTASFNVTNGASFNLQNNTLENYACSIDQLCINAENPFNLIGTVLLHMTSPVLSISSIL